MKASELAAQLRHLVNTEGDRDVVIQVDGFDLPINDIAVYDEHVGLES